MDVRVSFSDTVVVTVGKNVRKFRNEAGLSQEDVSKRCGIYRTYLSRIEGGTANPTVTVLDALAKSLQVKIEDLFME
jgi:transcriptional regulator with XRE-family HTH domain